MRQDGSAHAIYVKQGIGAGGAADVVGVVLSGLVWCGEDVVEMACEVAFETADRFAFAFAFGLFA